jgi:NAD(P) transhydrogenase subunit alpha
VHGVLVDPLITNLTVFVLPSSSATTWSGRDAALHTPLMSVTNAISSVIIVGAILAAGCRRQGSARCWAPAVARRHQHLRRVLVTERMLEMFKKKDPKK